MQKILIQGYFGVDNLGDDLLFCEALRSIPQQYKICVKLPSPCIINGRYVNPSQNISKFRYLRDFEIVSRFQICRYKFKALIYSGGGLFPSRNYSLKNLLSYYLLSVTSKFTIVSGCGVVPKENSFYFNLFLDRVQYCSVRDDISKKYIESLHHHAINCGDLYWGNFNDTSNVLRKKGTCLVCLANPFGRDELANISIKHRYGLFVETLSKVLMKIKSKGYELSYLPFFHGTDEYLIDDLQSLLRTNDKVLCYERDFTVDTVDQLFASFEIGFCMRYHSILLSIKNRLPMLAISYDYKSEMLLNEARLQDYGVNYGIRKSDFFGEEFDLDISLLLSTFDKVLEDKKTIIEKAISFYRKKHSTVLNNYNVIFNLLDKKHDY